MTNERHGYYMARPSYTCATALQPFFSIVVPTYERPAQLASCLHAFTALDYPSHRFEVIVVDDGSKTSIDDVVAPFRHQLDLTLLTQSNAGPAAARNAGARRARGIFLAFTDDDCAATPHWLQALAARFDEYPDHIVGGRTLNAIPSDSYATTSQVMTDAVYAYFNADSQDAQFFPTNNLALPRERFHAMGGFDTTFPLAASEDRDFCDRWLHAGNRMIYDPAVIVYHAHALTFRHFWQQHFNYGRGTFHFHHVKAQHGRGRVKADPGFYLHLLRYPFQHASRRQAVLLESLLMVAYVAKTAGFMWENLSQRTGKSSST
jgi:GT2 family glycosyltransferase